jgi:hypothetical protein
MSGSFREQARSHIQAHSNAGTRSTVGASLLAKAAPRSPTSNRIPMREPAQPWERACSRRPRLGPPHSSAFQCENPVNCGSEPAREGSTSVPHIQAHSNVKTRSTVGASLLAKAAPRSHTSNRIPMREPGQPWERACSRRPRLGHPHPTAFQCGNPVNRGSEPAREGSTSVPHIQAHSNAGTRSTVGASLLAKAATRSPTSNRIPM